MRNRVMLAAGTLAIVPTLLFAQQRPAHAPMQPMAGARDGMWELSAGVGLAGVGGAFNGTGSAQFMPGGMIRVGYNLTPMWNVSVGTGAAFGKSNFNSLTAYLTPTANVTWTPDINKVTSPFVTAGVGLAYRKDVGTSEAAVNLGVGVRHMVGDALALRVEGGLNVFSASSETSGLGLVTVGLSYFMGGKKILTRIAVNPGSATLASLRQTQQFAAMATDQKGRPMAGKMFTWRSSNASVATVSSTGVVTAVGDGSATISAMSEGVTGTANVMVSRTAATVAVAPTTASFNALGATQQLSASARDAGNSAITGASFTWSSSNPSVASVSASGLVTAVGNGTATITANSSGKTSTTTVTVAQMTASVTLTPSASALNQKGATAQYTATALDPNGRPISGKTFTWSSDATGVATVSPTGVATAVANGVAHIAAAVDGKTASAIATVVIAARPVELPETVGATLVMRAVQFRINRAVLTPAARTELDKVAITMQGMPNARWEIGGYTSSVGSRAVNMRLSRQRAEAVRTYLISKGVPAANVTAVGYGPANPVASNRTARGRADNRRVEVKRLQ
jgi:outer membrane protein OmpA-like peptidoglycan-associated protein